MSDKPSRATTQVYRDVLERLWMLDSLPGWLPTWSQSARLAQSPKHHLADPAFAVRLLGVTRRGLLTNSVAGVAEIRDGLLLGGLFESLVTLSVRVYAQRALATVHHLRTANGDHEVDLIIEGEDRRVVAVETKLSAAVEDRDVRHLHWLLRAGGARVADAIIVTTGKYAYRRADGIGVVPAALLAP